MRDGKERGWFMLDTPANCMKPNMHATNITRQIILAKINAEPEFRQQYASVYNEYYKTTSDGRLYHKEQDEVTEVTTKKELEDRLNSCFIYTAEFMREFRVKKALISETDVASGLGKK